MKRVLLSFLIATAFLLFGLTATSVAFAYVDEADFYLTNRDNFEQNSKICNGEDGCTHKIYLSETTYEGLIRIEYDVVKLKTLSEELTLGEGNVVPSDHECISKKNVVNKDLDITVLDTPSSKRYAYFSVTAHETSAFVFTVYYAGVFGEETAAYDSDILYCREIDDSVPEAYYESWVYNSGRYEFKVRILGNRRSDTTARNSGIKAFTVKKDGKKIDEVKNIGRTDYLYTLSVEPTKGTYTMDIIDGVGNGISGAKIVSFDEKMYDSDFETACNIVIHRMDSGEYEDYSDRVVNEYRTAYAEYYLLTQEEEKDIEAIEAKKTEINTLSRYLAELTAMKERGEKEVSVQSPGAADYFGSEITLWDAALAYPDQKYGEKILYTFSVAELSPTITSRESARKAAGINTASTLYSLTLNATLDGEELKVDFSEPLLVRVPIKKSVKAVLTSNGKSTALKTVQANGYVEIEVLSSYGTIDLFVDGKNDLRYLWSLTAIPVIAAVVVTIVLMKKKKKIKGSVESREESK